MLRLFKVMLLALFFFVVVFTAAYFAFDLTRPKPATLKPSRIVASVKNILKLGLLEINVDQIYEFSQDSLKFSAVPIPFTKQKILVRVDGRALFGFDVKQVNVELQQESQRLVVSAPPPTIIALETDYRFVHEEDGFLNRIQPEDRNRLTKLIKTRLTREILTPTIKQRVTKRGAELLQELGSWTGHTVLLDIREATD